MPVSVCTPEVPEVVERVERIVEEGAIGASAAAALMGRYRQGKPTHPSTVTRWMLKGYRGPDGRVFKLESIRIAGRLMTSKQALLRFVAAQNTDTTDTTAPTPPATPTPTPKQRARAAEKASREAAAIFGNTAATRKG